LTGFAKLTMLNALKNSLRNSVFIRSVTEKCLMMEMSTLAQERRIRSGRPLVTSGPAAAS
jgi:hypothetical protein